MSINEYSETTANNKDYTIKVDELRSIIWNQRNSALSKNGITIRILKTAWPAISMILSELMLECIRNNHFLRGWKKAEIIVTLKSRDKDIQKN